MQAQLRITARRRIGAWEGASGYAALRRAAPPHGPLALVGLGATSPTCGTLCESHVAKMQLGNLGLRDPLWFEVWIGDGLSWKVHPGFLSRARSQIANRV
jgi:hypothetical protein